MKTPSFWNTKNIPSNLLLPAAYIYEMVTTLRRAYAKPVKLPVPVICIGNLTAGGAGKTPVALHVGKLLKEKNIPVFFLSRGYGGKLKGPLLVDPKKHTARQVGDEPLLLAQLLPTVIAKNRVDGALYAIQKGARAIIMDDGFQNHAIAKSLSLVVIDGQAGFGNGRLLPAGPLRESPEIGMKRAHAVIVVGRGAAMPPLPPGKPVLFAKTQATEDAAILKGKKMLAFCGIAHPQKFSQTLAGLGVTLVGVVAFPDHHIYQKSDIKKLVAEANKHKAGLLTTAKDAVRLPPAFREQVTVVDITLAFDNPALLDTILDYTISHAKT